MRITHANVHCDRENVRGHDLMVIMVSMIKQFMVEIVEFLFKFIHGNLLLCKLVFRQDVPEYNVFEGIFFHRTHKILIGIELIHEFLDVRLHIIDILDDPVGHLALNVLFGDFQAIAVRKSW